MRKRGHQHGSGGVKDDKAESEKDHRKDSRRDKQILARLAEDAESESALSIPLCIALFAVVLAVYVRTAYPTVPGGDAGELIFTSCSLGVAHPPGYPLFILLGHLFYRFIPYGTPGFRVNCLSCLCGATATLLLFLFCQRWYASCGYRGSCGWALLVAGSWALSPLLWQYHVQAEVFALNNLLVACQFLLAQLHYETCEAHAHACTHAHAPSVRKERARTAARLGALVVGLGFSNQHAIVFYSLPIVLLVILNDMGSHRNVADPTFFLQLVACGLVGLSPYLHMPLAASRSDISVLGSWGDQRTVEGLLKHMLRREYGTWRLYSGSDGVYTPISTWARLYLVNLGQNFFFFGPPLFLVGLASCILAARRDRMGALVAGMLTYAGVC